METASVKRPAEEAAAGDDGRNIRLKTEGAPVEAAAPRREEKLPVLRYREGEPLVELVQHLAAATSGADEAGTTAPSSAEGAQAAAAAGAANGTSTATATDAATTAAAAPPPPLPPRVEVRVPADAASNQNRQVRARQLWGTDVYTHDSDVVAVLMHQGYYSHALSSPPPQLAEVRAVLRVLPPRRRYVGSSRNCVRSRGWASAPDDEDDEKKKEGGAEGPEVKAEGGGDEGAAAATTTKRTQHPKRGLEGCAFSIERAYIVLRGGAQAPLKPCGPGTPPPLPTFRPAFANDKAVSTRSTSAAAARDLGRARRAAAEVALQYSLSGEPWLKYSAAAVADRGLKRHQWTSARLSERSVLLLETHSERYELARVAVGEVQQQPKKEEEGGSDTAMATAATENDDDEPFHSPDVFRWAKVAKPFPLRAMRKMGLPLPATALEPSGVVLLKWEEIAWGQASVVVKGESVPIVRVLFTPRCEPGTC